MEWEEENNIFSRFTILHSSFRVQGDSTLHYLTDGIPILNEQNIRMAIENETNKQTKNEL